MFDSFWNPKCQIIKGMQYNPNYKISRCFDWGSSAPFANLWVMESNGEDLPLENGKTMSTIPGDLFVYDELYGWNGRPNQGLKLINKDIGRMILQKELTLPFGNLIRPGPADSKIFDHVNGTSYAKEIAAPHKMPDGNTYNGPKYTAANKKKGSRVMGCDQISKMLKAAVPVDGILREEPALFISDRCEHLIRTLPTAQRCPKDPNDIDSTGEDHLLDALRYRVLENMKEFGVKDTVGLY
jgi:hypothetical protein